MSKADDPAGQLAGGDAGQDAGADAAVGPGDDQAGFLGIARKWWVATVSAVIGWLATWTAVGHWPHVSSQLAAAGIAILLQRVLAYLVANDGPLAALPGVRGGSSPAASPSAKWWTATIIPLIAFPVTWGLTGHWTRDLTSQVIAIAGQRILAYIVPNS